ncbi:holo-ACP synthase [Bacillus massiliigorillae]|uniref:holo-ACP synthase n=1 Tax=Bacillus massiliigorillae TaxID=1243664 RepID=UPI0003AA49B2|nr:holo-ACP synthase [Bacillus massiliigorillae]
MIKGIGLDIIEIDRVRQLVEKQPKFVKRILTDDEQKRYESLKSGRRIEYLAGRFAVKEAFSKAVGTGIGEGLSFLDIETSYDDKGKPCITKPISEGVHVSITHSQAFAAAQVIIEA